MSLASSRRDNAIKLEHRKLQCPEKKYRGNVNPNFEPVVARSTMYHRIFQEVQLKIKKDYGHGVSSWSGDMKRRNARLIMRRLARRTFRNMREQMNQTQGE